MSPCYSEPWPVLLDFPHCSFWHSLLNALDLGELESLALGRLNYPGAPSPVGRIQSFRFEQTIDGTQQLPKTCGFRIVLPC